MAHDQSAPWPTGHVQIYTGDGKGKTTAALGLTMRAAGAGLHVLFTQFMKHGDYSEIRALRQFSDQVKVHQFGRPEFMWKKPTAEDIQQARNGLACIRQELATHTFHMAVIDEGTVAVNYGLLDVEELIALIDDRPTATELIITGRNAHPRLLERADLVTEMQMVKHYYNKGVPARVGIEK